MRNLQNRIIIGVDGGGTGCRAAIGTRERGIAARAEGALANFASDPKQSIDNVITTIDIAVEKSGMNEEGLAAAAVHLGLAGVMSLADARAVSDAMPFEHVTVTSDQPTAVAGALNGQDGFLLSVGTGTIAARSVAGRFKYIGGWGFHVADQASGAWVGRAGLQQALLCHDGVDQHTELTRLLLERFDNDPYAIATFGQSAKPGEFGALAPDIVAAAVAGDRWGQAIMSSGAEHLQRCLAALKFKSGDTLCLTGGLGPHYIKYLPTEFLLGQIPRHGDALDGAFQLAMQKSAQPPRNLK